MDHRVLALGRRSLQMRKANLPIDPLIKELIGFHADDPDQEVIREWKKASA